MNIVIAAKFYAGVCGLILLVVGLIMVLMSYGIYEFVDIQSMEDPVITNLRGRMGGLLVGLGALLIVGVFYNSLLVSAVSAFVFCISAIAIVRLGGALFTGFVVKWSAVAMVELVLAAIGVYLLIYLVRN